MSLDSVEAMGPTLRLLGAMRADDAEHTQSEEPLQPRPGSTRGHAEWLVHLREVKGARSLELHSFELTTGDLCCLAQALGPEVKVRA